MKSPATRGNSDTVSLFPFLAVLLCTMGALLVLLVVLAQKAKEQALDDVVSQAQATPRDLPAADQAAAEEAKQLAQQLQQLHRYQQQLASLRAEAEAKQRDSQLRLSHLEEHTRRLEHELARLYLASEQLKATEKTQIVDQKQADHELVRLKELIEEGQQELEKLRQDSHGKRSYAIIPYRGPRGTARRPIYVECSSEGVVIQPEGIRLTAKDFIAPFDSGNPLAKALRAARELLNDRAAKMGESEPPDPYPLLVVRPDGIEQYAAARTAIESWDADFGYEFINDQWSLQYPESDPELAQAMRHAVMQGRERIAMLIQAAPRRYGRLGLSTPSGRHATGGSGQMAGNAHGTSTGSGWDTTNTQSTSSQAAANQAGSMGGLAGGNAERDAKWGAGAQPGKGTGTTAGHTTLSGSPGTRSLQAQDQATGDLAANGQLGGFSSGQGTRNPSPGSDYTETATQGAYAGSTYTGSTSRGSTNDLGRYGEPIPPGAGTGSQPTGPQTASPGNATQFAASEARGGQAGSPGTSSATTSGGSSFGSSSTQNSSASRGGPSSAQASGGIHSTSNSPNNGSGSSGNSLAFQKPEQDAVPIRRPIQVVIRQDRIVILQSRQADENTASNGSMISLNQPTRQVMEEFVKALRKHMNDWGLAGNGLYWRPVLHLNVGPRGQQQATRLTPLLESSGIEIDSAHTARQNGPVPVQATR